MQTGKLRHKIIIQQPTESRNAEGDVISTWSAYDTVYADIYPLIGKEYWAATQTQDQEKVKFSIRYIDGVTQKMRILYDQKAHDIISIQNVNERNRELIIITNTYPLEYPEFSYSGFLVSDTGITGRLDFSWNTDGYSSSKLQYKNIFQVPWTTTDETDTDPRVMSHTVRAAGFEANNTYYWRVWGENEHGWTPGYSATQTLVLNGDALPEI